MLEGLFEFGRPFPRLRDLFFSLSFFLWRGVHQIQMGQVKVSYTTYSMQLS